VSGKWCPYCRQFTPTLIEFTEKLKEEGLEDFEVVLVSRDRDEKGFIEHLNSTPFVAIPFSKWQLREDVMDAFSVRSVPSLIIVNPLDGSVVDFDGRNTVVNAIRHGDVTTAKRKWGLLAQSK
jgi:nucleoredoxin